MTAAQDEVVDTYRDRLGVQMACTAAGVPERSYRHRRHAREQPQAAAGRGDASQDVSPTSPTDSSVHDPTACERDDSERDDGALREAITESEVARAAIERAAQRARHPAALSREERFAVLEVLCSDAYCDLPPAQVFTRLLDEGTYLCSVRSMYRILGEHGLTGERRRGGHQSPGHYPVPVVHATRPNEAWTWDVTKLRGPAKGVVYFLYTILDIFSRKIVGWTLATSESEHIARELIKETIEREGVPEGQLTLHADRGGPMISGTVAELLASLNVRKSHNRPRVSNDNPFVESAYKTLKYRPDYPARFEGLQAARAWCRTFFAWYNHEHYHSGIAFLTPADLHAGRHPDILEQRRTTLETAYAQNPQRFRRPPKPAQPPSEAWINRPTLQTS